MGIDVDLHTCDGMASRRGRGPERVKAQIVVCGSSRVVPLLGGSTSMCQPNHETADNNGIRCEDGRREEQRV